MSRETSPYIVGEFWLDKRRNGRSPDIWQIAWYDTTERQLKYLSTKCRTVDLEAAKEILRTHEAKQRSKARGQDPEESLLVPHIMNYIRERGPEVKRLDTIKSSARAWIGFLQQDELSTGAVVADVTKTMVARFRRWRMGPHSYAVEWGGKTFNHNSPGVSGEAVQRNIEDLRAALHHAEDEGRVRAPKVPSVERKYLSRPRDLLLSAEQLGAMLGYAKGEPDAYRWLCLMLATGSRPGAALAFNPATQWSGGVLDLHPGGLRTDKRNAVVPVIPPMVPILKEWSAEPHAPVKSRKRWWRTMRSALELPAQTEAYTIRHTVSTWLDSQGVPGAQISGIMGHIPAHRGVARTTGRHYFHYDPTDCPQAVDALCSLFQAAHHHAEQWGAVHMLCKGQRGRPTSIAKIGE